ncbi:RagB/SusD family nutrient uptake outer membrane protein [Pontibacter beigongshangensis]|uniref:RagB/SusD family nutrient uptake outer membrane protein n=1 Tax=Pontibacter beigongshangensis TaxID=2574733 RepID=UPI00164F141F|nr:RagB/SusD family nutrient uptake outer membrane protein [Pontibacter beigongshangensis]
MYNNKILRFALIALVFIASSCDKWLYLEPQDAIVRQQFWQTKEQANAALIGCYSSLLDGDLGYKMFAWGELRADMVTPNDAATLDEREIVGGNILESNNITNWRPFYKTINYCNTLIEFAPQVQQFDPTYKTETLNADIAEAKAIRSLMYFYLVRTFGEVPLKLDATVSDETGFTLAKSSEAEVLQFIIQDLKEAEINAVTNFGNSTWNKGRFTKAGIQALLADVYLWNEDYDACIATANKIIDSGQFGLVAGNTSWYHTLYVAGNSPESIFEIQYGAQPHPFFPIIRNQRRFIAAPHVLEELYSIDFVNPDNADIRADGASLRSDGRIWKYIGQNSSDQRTDVAPYPNWIVYRYADVLLMKAEALAQKEQGEEALQLVNMIRTRANALEATERGVEFDDVNGLTDYILEERAREFAFEGKRWFDVLRNSRRKNYARLDILLSMVTMSAPADRQQSILNKYRDRMSHYLPIFQFELQTNKNLVQNQFYAK